MTTRGELRAAARAVLAAVLLASAPAAAQAPAARLAVTDGAAETPLAERIDLPAVVHLWATWCAPCLDELPQVADLLAGDARARRVVVVSVDTAPPSRVAGFLADLDIALPPLKIAAGNAGAAFGVEGYPATVFLAADGSVARVHAGPLDWSSPAVRAGILAHLGQ